MDERRKSCGRVLALAGRVFETTYVQYGYHNHMSCFCYRSLRVLFSFFFFFFQERKKSFLSKGKKYAAFYPVCTSTGHDAPTLTSRNPALGSLPTTSIFQSN